MASDYYSRTEGAGMAFLDNLVNQIDGLFTLSGLTAADIMAIK